MALVPLRVFLFPKIIKPAYLMDLDAEDSDELPPTSKSVRASDGLMVSAEWFPEEHEETAQELLQEFTYGRFYTTFRHLLSRSQVRQHKQQRLQAKVEYEQARQEGDPEGQQQQQQQLKRRHSIDVPHMHWHKRSYPDLSNLDTAEDDDDRKTNLSSRDRANEKLNFSSF